MRQKNGPSDTPRKSLEPRLLRLIVAAWGPQDSAIAQRLTLPSLLSLGNLPSLDKGGFSTSLTLCCLAREKAAYEQADGFIRCAAGRSVDWLFVDRWLAEIGDSREAVLAEVYRHAIAAEEARETAFVVVKPGTLIGDGGLSFVAEALRQGARAVMAPIVFASIPTMLKQAESEVPFSPKAIVRSCRDDPAVFTSSYVGEAKDGGYSGSDRLSVARDEDSQILMAARWHPIGLRPSATIDPERQSLFDSEVVPELAETEEEVCWAGSSDEVLLVDARSESWLARRFDVESLSAAEAVERIRSWATPWQLRALKRRYVLSSNEAGAPDVSDDPFADVSTSQAPGVPALRHPLWLSARGLRMLSPALALEKRYQSDLDDYYRVTTLAITAARADEVVYLGFAGHVFAPLLCRLFHTSYVGDPDRFLAGGAIAHDASKKTAVLIHVEAASFHLFFIDGNGADRMLALARQAMTVLLLVEAPDSQGGFDGWDLGKFRDWHEGLERQARRLGATCRIASTVTSFFHGHPGFVVSLVPADQSKRPLGFKALAAAVGSGVPAEPVAS